MTDAAIEVSAEVIQSSLTLEEARERTSFFIALYGSINSGSSHVNGRTPLHCAVLSNKKWLVEYILSWENIDVNVQCSSGETPLIYACQRGNFLIVELLALYGADPDIYDNNNDSALLWACYYGYYNIVKFLVETLNADVNHRYRDGRNALMWSCKTNHYHLADYLYYKVDNINLVGNDGETAANLATEPNIRQLFAENSDKTRGELFYLFFKHNTHVLYEKNIVRIVIGMISAT